MASECNASDLEETQSQVAKLSDGSPHDVTDMTDATIVSDASVAPEACEPTREQTTDEEPEEEPEKERPKMANLLSDDTEKATSGSEQEEGRKAESQAVVAVESEVKPSAESEKESAKVKEESKGDDELEGDGKMKSSPLQQDTETSIAGDFCENVLVEMKEATVEHKSTREEVSAEVDDFSKIDELEPLPSPSSTAANSSLLRRLKESPPVTLTSSMTSGLRRPAVASAVVKPIPPFDTLNPELASILEGVKVIPSGVGIEESEEEAIDKAKVLAIRVKEACQTVPALTEMMQILHGKSLESETFAFQSAYLFGCLSQLEVDQVKCRNIFLRKIQADFGRRSEIRSANYSHYLNLVTLLCQVFRRVRVADGTTIGALSEPILACFQDILEEPNDAGLIVFSKQVQIVCLELGRIQPEKLDELFAKVRMILTEPRGLSTRCLASILMVFELYLEKWRPLAIDTMASDFYARHVPADARFSPMQVSRLSTNCEAAAAAHTNLVGGSGAVAAAAAAAEQLLMAGLTLNETPINLPDVTVPPPNMMPPRHKPPPHMMMPPLPSGPPRGGGFPPPMRGQLPPHHPMGGGFDMRGRRSLRASKSMIDSRPIVDEWQSGSRMRTTSPQIDEWQAPSVGGNGGGHRVGMGHSRMGVSRTNSDQLMGRGVGRDSSSESFWSPGGEVSASKWSTNDENIPGAASSTWSNGGNGGSIPGHGNGSGSTNSTWGSSEHGAPAVRGGGIHGNSWNDFPPSNPTPHDLGSTRGQTVNGGWGEPTTVWGSSSGSARDSPSAEPKSSSGWGEPSSVGVGSDSWGSNEIPRGSSNGWPSSENKTSDSGWGSSNPTSSTTIGGASSWSATEMEPSRESAPWSNNAPSGTSGSGWGGENTSSGGGGEGLGSWGSSKLVVPQVSSKSWNVDDEEDSSGTTTGLSSGGWGTGNIGGSGAGWG